MPSFHLLRANRVHGWSLIRFNTDSLQLPVLRGYIVLSRRLIMVFTVSMCLPVQILRVKLMYFMQTVKTSLPVASDRGLYCYVVLACPNT